MKPANLFVVVTFQAPDKNLSDNGEGVSETEISIRHSDLIRKDGKYENVLKIIDENIDGYINAIEPYLVEIYKPTYEKLKGMYKLMLDHIVNEVQLKYEEHDLNIEMLIKVEVYQDRRAAYATYISEANLWVPRVDDVARDMHRVYEGQQRFMLKDRL